MALNWDIRNVQDSDDIKTDAEWPITEGLIWASMVVQLGSITEDNADEWAYRLRILEKVGRGIMIHPDVKGGYMPKLADVRRRIGLRTNVSNEDRTTFWKNVRRVLEEDTNRELRVEAEKLGVSYNPKKATVRR